MAGGGWTKSQILEIMKDSRVGTYAVVGLILLIFLKIFTLITLLEYELLFCLKSIVLAHVLSRWSVTTIIYTHNYSRADSRSKVKPIAKKLSLTNLLVASLWLFFVYFISKLAYTSSNSNCVCNENILS